MTFGVFKREEPTIKTFQKYTNKEMEGYEIKIYEAIIWFIRGKDHQVADFLELLLNMCRLGVVLTTEDEALGEPIAEELMNSPMFKAWCRSALERVMEDPTIVPENVKDFLKV